MMLHTAGTEFSPAGRIIRQKMRMRNKTTAGIPGVSSRMPGPPPFFTKDGILMIYNSAEGSDRHRGLAIASCPKEEPCSY
ncbi:MAG: hypothetical protein RDV48_28150 [Candidatus Eremiobacteraeota bacterium]|nr:hypothetical protein [Candidatus Eremiobacteraeota bacterium]